MAEQPTEAAKKADADWYDEFYRKEQIGLPPWYRFLFPALEKELKPDHKLVELGCGQGHILRLLAQQRLVREENITGIDQSQTAVDFAHQKLPHAELMVGDIYKLDNLKDGNFDVCLLMETIEHLEQPEIPIANIRRILKPGGLLFVSFPNYLHLPWLVVRILAEKLNRPNWIVLQPVDKIYTVFSVIKLFRKGGFRFLRGIGCNYGPPVLYPLETDGMTRFFNKMRLWRLSLHPVLVFQRE